MNIEEFVNSYLQEHRHDVLLNPYDGLIEFTELFLSELMKEAMEGQIYGSDGDHWVESEIYENLKGKEGDKVRIIVVKAEEE